MDSVVLKSMGRFHCFFPFRWYLYFVDFTVETMGFTWIYRIFHRIYLDL